MFTKSDLPEIGTSPGLIDAKFDGNMQWTNMAKCITKQKDVKTYASYTF